MAMGEGIQEHKPDKDRQVQAAIENLAATGVMPKAKINNFDTFCNVVLAYESRLEESKRNSKGPIMSHAQATDESSDSEAVASPPTSEQSEDVVDEDIEYPPGHESFENVTCFCGKPFAGKPAC